ncbi:uncharacterized protein CC84DRAFT_190551 [Paraphaeosphaeria sporulosa]|uniref:Uncharacterized protein n=1 Tax=Paraphaeosphaeria sporulosa TaxID=1460663 RepID=A0A177C3L5_9PLEO|nr:uncharacterized protein CC84DRAFT_190551 [Paraphaeosphaeria sporulosa]OAG01378.1 hypothetical protein CC84DRAFT_190551 [Paraphaeosphaeria sporulosa]
MPAAVVSPPSQRSEQLSTAGILDVVAARATPRATARPSTASGTKVLTVTLASRMRTLGREPFFPFGSWACLTREQLHSNACTGEEAGLCGMRFFHSPTHGRMAGDMAFRGHGAVVSRCDDHPTKPSPTAARRSGSVRPPHRKFPGFSTVLWIRWLSRTRWDI